MGGHGMAMGGPYGAQDPSDPYGAPPSPSALQMQGVVNFFGRIPILIDQNIQDFHMFITALLQLFDRSGMLYGELARFLLRLLGIRTKPKKVRPPGPNGLPLPGPNNMHEDQKILKAPKAAPGAAWGNVWGNDV